MTPLDRPVRCRQDQRQAVAGRSRARPGNLERAPAPTNVIAGRRRRASSTSWRSRHGCSTRCATRPQRERIAVIVPSRMARPRCCSITMATVLAAPDYEDPCFEEVTDEYARSAIRIAHLLARPAAGTQSRPAAVLPADSAAGRCSRAWRTCCCIRSTGRGDCRGVMASEVTSLGTHSDLWRPHEQAFSPARSQAGLGAAACRRAHRANDRLGPIRDRSPPRPGLPAACEVACGIHDSNASYLRFLIDREREAFTVVSSGTWTIVMANRGDLRRLREDRDMLANVNAFGAPVATARYMGGREYEAIARRRRRADGRRGHRGDFARARLPCRHSRARAPMQAAPAASRAPTRWSARSARRWPLSIPRS